MGATECSREGVGSDVGGVGSHLRPGTCCGASGDPGREGGRSKVLGQQLRPGLTGTSPGWKGRVEDCGGKSPIRIYVLKIIARASIRWNICWGQRKE